MSREFIGAGVSYPLTTDATGSVALVREQEEVEQAILLILGTALGERPMRPEFGCRIHEHIFDPVNEATIGVIGLEVREALDRWEPRIEVQDVSVLVDRQQPGLLYIDITYAVRDENDPRNLVFPFYTIPEE